MMMLANGFLHTHWMQDRNKREMQLKENKTMQLAQTKDLYDS